MNPGLKEPGFVFGRENLIMLFKDIIDEKQKALEPEFDLLFEEIIKNQKHNGDMLLILINGSYNTDVLKSPRNLSPYIIGPNKEGHSEVLHYEFIHNYRTTYLADIPHSEYLKEFEWSEEKSKQIEEHQKFEGTTIQLEMMIYLKIWEADAFIKRFYQFARLLNGENYDWNFRLSESSRDANSTGTRQDIIRKQIRNKFKTKFPAIYTAFENAYKTQIRNSIAHSNYSFQSRYIHLNNTIEGDPASLLTSISFDDWISKFHDTMVIYNQYIKLKTRINEYYSTIAKSQDLKFEILVTKDKIPTTHEYRQVKYRPDWNDWNWDK